MQGYDCLLIHPQLFPLAQQGRQVQFVEMKPLDNITENQFKSLFGVLWGWKTCPGQKPQCDSRGCPCRRAEQLGPFKEFYRTTTARYLPEFSASTEVAFRSHDDVIDLIRHLQGHADVPREDLTVQYFSNRARDTSRHEPPNSRDQHRACNIAARILTMVTCTTENQAEDFLEDGIRLPMWEAKDSLAGFMGKNFPKTDHPTLNDISERRRGKQLKDSLGGRRLTKIAGLTFQPTNNLADHLRLHANEGYVEIFHHTRALKEILIATRGEDSGALSGEKVVSTEYVVQLDFIPPKSPERGMPTLMTPQSLPPQTTRTRGHRLNPANTLPTRIRL